MEKRNYLFKEVLLGLRDAYLENARELELLKEFTEVEDEKKVKELYYSLFWREQDEAPELNCWIIPNKSKVSQKIQYIKERIGSYYHESNIHKCTFDNNGRMSIWAGKIHVFGDSPLFKMQVKKILNSSFALNTPVDPIYCSNQGEIPSLDIDYELIRYVYSTPFTFRCFEYNPVKNTILFGKRDAALTREEIEAILNSKYSKARFPKYQQSVIDNSVLASKEIELVDLPERDEACAPWSSVFELDEHENVVLLKKKIL